MGPKWQKFFRYLRVIRSRRYKLWMVDDEERWRTYFVQTYGNDPLFTIRCFESPLQVLHELEKGGKPDLLLVDVFFTDDEKELQEHAMEKELEQITAQADQVWEKYQKLYTIEGLELTEVLLEKNVPFCLYTGKGVSFIRSKAIGEKLVQILRRVDLVSKSSSHRIAERNQIVRYIEEARALEERKLHMLRFLLGIIFSSVISILLTAYWGAIGRLIIKLIGFLFPK